MKALWIGLLLTCVLSQTCGCIRPTRRKPATFHIIFSTECTPYFDWQTVALLHSYVQTNQTGGITRLMACDDVNYSAKDLTDRFFGAKTYVHPNYAKHPKTGDNYPAYNKPFSVLHWLRHAEPEEDYIVFLDADMVIRSKISVEIVGAQIGRPVSAYYGYLEGVDKDSYMEVKAQVPNVDKAQKVGGFMVMHKEDMKRVAPLWLHYTEEVRNKPGNWANTGDIYNQNGKAGPPWISEMYGYVFACAHAKLRHRVSDTFMLYPGYQPPPEPFPLVLHYGITFHVGKYAFDKHWFRDLTTCPGKNIDYPYSLDEIAYLKSDKDKYRTSVVALYVAQTVHEALEDHQLNYCKISQSALEQRYRHVFKCKQPNNVIACKPTATLRGTTLEIDIQTNENRAGIEHTEGPENAQVQNDVDCHDKNAQCCSWSHAGECERNPAYMLLVCRAACGQCGHSSCERSASKPESASSKSTSDAGPSDMNPHPYNKGKMVKGPPGVSKDFAPSWKLPVILLVLGVCAFCLMSLHLSSTTKRARVSKGKRLQRPPCSTD